MDTPYPTDTKDPQYNKKFTQWLRSRKGGSIPHDPKKVRAVKGGANPIGLTEYPPMNTDIRFKVGKYKTLKQKVRGAPMALPENWNNFTGNDWKYKNTVRPQQQGSCGSCFSVSTATAITDSFVFKEGFKPDISPMYILSCRLGGDSNVRCSGGNPMSVLQDIATNGVATSHCIDYNTICSSGPCNSNAMIPPCGCCNTDFQHYKFFVNHDPVLAYETSKDPDDNGAQSGAVQMIKEHLFSYGTAIAGFMCRTNFKSGNFSKTKGVYFDTETYEDIGPEETLGGHAICIVGWGVETNVPAQGVTYDKVPYWVVRNSWGENWAENGYCKYAMYQPSKDGKPAINEQGGFERMHEGGWGGIILFTPSKFEKFDSEKTNCRINNKNLYDAEPIPGDKPKPPPNNPLTPDSDPDIPLTPDSDPDNTLTPPQDHDNFYMVLILLLVLFVSIILIYMSLNK
jgi:hypothetical protein